MLVVFRGIDAPDSVTIDRNRDNNTQGSHIRVNNILRPDVDITQPHDIQGASSTTTGQALPVHIPRWLVVARAGDTDCDGKPDTGCINYELDANGNAIRIRRDVDCDGKPKTCDEREYDDEGRLILERTYKECGPEIISCFSKTYDSHGDVVSFLTDDGCDGILDDGFFYLATGDPNITELHYLSMKPPGCIITRIEEAGGAIYRHRLENCEGKPRGCSKTTVGELNGNLVTYVERDDDCDGEPETRERRIENDDGNAVLVETFAGDTLIYRSKVEYGHNGELLEERTDNDGDGLDDVCRKTISVSAGRFSSTQTDEGCDGVPERCRVCEYDEAGKEIRSFTDYDCDGTADADCVTQEYELR